MLSLDGLVEGREKIRKVLPMFLEKYGT